MSYIYTINDNWIDVLPDVTTTTFNKKSKHKEEYYNLYCGFDIETTTIINQTNKDITRHAYMYIWQFCINEIVITGRTWDDFFRLIDILEDKYSGSAKILIFIHNMGFEMSFMLARLNDRITNQFYKDKYKPLFVEIDNKIRFQDSLAITGVSLEKTAEIYNLKYKKLAGDLDYTLKRNSLTKLTQKELMYCYMDVLILSDFARKIFTEIAPKNFNKIPLTKTQLFLNKVFKYMTRSEKMHCHDIIISYSEYLQMNRYLFRGGYVHANFAHNGEVINNVQSVDFTSSYPAVMLHNNNYPVGKFRNVNIDILTKERFYNLLNNYACWIDVSFYNIKRTTNHTIESRNKIVAIGGHSIFDNGRLSEAEYINVQLTELDFDIYEHFYEWDEMQINSIKIARRGTLPAGLLKALKEDYIKKSELKRAGLNDTIEYLLAKQNINSAYGACCKKIPFNNWTYQNGWTNGSGGKMEAEVYSEWSEKTNILPFQFACWITANARHNLLVDGVARVGDDCLYCDTDSMKVRNYNKHRHVIQEYNAKMEELNKPLCEINTAFNDLGFFDENDGFYSSFKTLGSKRYVNIEDNKPHVTIAGLPKKSLVKHIEKHNIDLMDAFVDGLSIPSEESGKITTDYNDEPHSDTIIDYQGNTETMTELSSCALYEIPFNMSLTREYLDFIKRTFNTEHNYLGG